MSAHGMAVIAAAPGIPALFDDLQNSIFAKIEHDGNIEYSTVSLGDESITENQIQSDLEKTFGMPKDRFTTYNSRGTTICMLSGLSYPKSRLDKIDDYMQQHKRPAAQEIELKSDMSQYLGKKEKSVPSDPTDIDDIWDEFDA